MTDYERIAMLIGIVVGCIIARILIPMIPKWILNLRIKIRKRRVNRDINKEPFIKECLDLGKAQEDAKNDYLATDDTVCQKANKILNYSWEEHEKDVLFSEIEELQSLRLARQKAFDIYLETQKKYDDFTTGENEKKYKYYFSLRK